MTNPAERRDSMALLALIAAVGCAAMLYAFDASRKCDAAGGRLVRGIFLLECVEARR